MPVDSDASDGGSRSLLKSLNRFQYHKTERAERLRKGVTYSDSDASNPSDGNDHTIPTSKGQAFAEKTESEISLTSNGHNSGDIYMNSTNEDFPIMRVNLKAKRRIASDSENEEPIPSACKKLCISEDEKTQGSAVEVVEEDIFNDKERCLRVLIETFPKNDVTALSDVLMKTNWNVNLAISMFREQQSQKNGSIPPIPTKMEESSEEEIHIVRIVPPGRSKVHKKTHELSDEDDDVVVRRIRLSTHALSDESDDGKRQNTSPPQTSKKIVRSRNRLLVKRSKHRNRKDVQVDSDCEDYEQGYSSSDSDDSDIDDTMTPARAALLELLNDGTFVELASIPGCSKKKADVIVDLRPFSGWADLVRKFQNSRLLSRDLLTKAKDVIYMRDVMKKLMKNCERISLEIEDVMNELLRLGAEKSYISKQPAILNDKMTLAPYQLIGLNWLYIMHKQQLNGILADEMGLGKTIQAIAFLGYLQEMKEKGHHLVVVPSSTLDNWLHEFQQWCPSINVVCYHGSQDERKEIRLQIVNDEIDWHVMVTTYNMIASSVEDRGLFRRLRFHYVIFDEAHMLKNMASQRYQNLMRIMAKRRLLLTGTPLQNNLVELMSLLIFVMPGMFHDKIEQVKQMFSAACKLDDERSKYEKERITHAKSIMKPFVLRRLKSEVLQQLPHKHEEIVICSPSASQQEKYETLVTELSKKVREDSMLNKGTGNGVGMMMMELRKAANHPLLLRRFYTNEKLRKMSKLMLQEPTHKDANPQLIFEDMQVMSDFELHNLCRLYHSVSSFQLEEAAILDSGKFLHLDKFLSKCKDDGSRVLLFSQFTMMLDIIEAYMKMKRHKFLRLDGSIPVQERQDLIDKYNDDPSIFIFLLSTKAGGLGINLTAANVVVIHDIDFNPYNDKQAEDRCHRVGQTKEVYVSRLISKNTIEEGMLQAAQDKLRLEKDVTMEDDKDEENIKCVTTLLKQALGM